MSRPLISWIEGCSDDEETGDRDQEEAQKRPQPGEDSSEVVADGGEDGIGGVSGTTFEITATEVTLGFQVADHGLDGGASSQFAFDDAEDAALLSGDEDAARVVRVMTAVTLVDIAALDLAACEFLSILDDLAQGMPVVWVVRQRLGVQHELAARGAGVGGYNRNLDAELVGRTGLALADAFGLGGMEGIQLPAALALLLGSDLGGAHQREGKRRLDVRAAFDLAAAVTDRRIGRPRRVRRMRSS